MISEKDAKAAATRIVAALGEAGEARPGRNRCNAYRAIEHDLKALAPMIAEQDPYGPALSRALVVLLAVCDDFCPL